MHQRVVGIVENMSYLITPGGERLEVFGSGGADAVAKTLGERLGHDVPVLGKVPLEEQLRVGGDDGRPIVATHPGSESAKVLQQVADTLTGRSRGLAGMQLGLAPVGRL